MSFLYGNAMSDKVFRRELEILLRMYFWEQGAYLNKELFGTLQAFMEHCKTNDMLQGTGQYNTMRAVYSSDLPLGGQKILAKVALSKSSLFRFRQRVTRQLYSFLHRNGVLERRL